MASNGVRQEEEIDALQAIFGGDGEFELLGEVPSDGHINIPVSFRVKQAGVPVLVTLPSGYPAQDSPAFVLEGFKPHQTHKIIDHLASMAKELVGEECVFEVLQALEELLIAEGLKVDAFGAQDTESEMVEADQKCDAPKSSWGWATDVGSDTVLRVCVNSGAKIRSTQITNTSELRRMPRTPTICLDIQPSRNTENYELAHFFASHLRIPDNTVDLIVGGKKEKASGERQVRIIGLPAGDIVQRILA